MVFENSVFRLQHTWCFLRYFKDISPKQKRKLRDLYKMCSLTFECQVFDSWKTAKIICKNSSWNALVIKHETVKIVLCQNSKLFSKFSGSLLP